LPGGTYSAHISRSKVGNIDSYAQGGVLMPKTAP